MQQQYLHLLIFVLFTCLGTNAQDITLFTVTDFELNGPVKKCVVIKDYGKEIFEFSENGFLIKSTTQYNETDKDITVYRFEGDHLIEKRLESYKDGQLDVSTSMANIFEIDTTGLKTIKEQIISYDKEFFEQQQYFYNEDGLLSKVVSSHENAVDETTIDYGTYKNEETTSVFENGVLLKSVRKSTKKGKGNKEVFVELVKEFVDGEPSDAIESITDSSGKLLSKQLFLYDKDAKQFAPSERHSYEYNANGVLEKVLIERGNTKSVNEFAFQFDDSGHQNWVKKITMPQNTYISRNITYFETAEKTED